MPSVFRAKNSTSAPWVFAGGANGGGVGRISGCSILFPSARAVTAVPPVGRSKNEHEISGQTKKAMAYRKYCLDAFQYPLDVRGNSLGQPSSIAPVIGDHQYGACTRVYSPGHSLPKQTEPLRRRRRSRIGRPTTHSRSELEMAC
jgi:hypothetical protein